MTENSPLLGISQRVPPSDTRAEQSLLGSILRNPKAFDRVSDFLRPEHFADPLHGRIYGECARLIVDGKVADPITLKHWFEAQPDAQAYGGVSYLAQLLQAMVGVVNAGEYGRTIQAHWLRRKMIGIGENLVDRSFGADETPPDVLASTVNALEDTILAGTISNEVTIAEAIGRVMEGMENARNGVVPAIYSTGMPELDEIVGGGLRPGDEFVLGGRPGHGKTALACKMIWSMARQYGFPILVLSMEMTAEQLAVRMMSQDTGIPFARIEIGQVTMQEADRLLKCQREMSELKIVFDDRARQGMSKVKLAIRRFKRTYGKPGLVAIDHLHLMPMDAGTIKGGLGLTFGTGEIANQLKECAKEEKCPFLVLAQLSRNKEGSDDKVPTMSDLKNSGDIEAAADTVLFTHRPELHLHKAKPSRKPGESDSEYTSRELAYRAMLQEAKGKAILVSGKCRYGATGAIEVEFDGPTTNFVTVPQNHI